MSDETTDEPDREGQEGNGAERDEDSAERIRYTLEPRQRLIFLGVGLLLFVVQLFNGNLGYAIAFLAAFVALYFAWGQWGVELRSDGLFLSGFQTQEVPWERIREIKSTRFLATDRVIVELTDDSLVRPRADLQPDSTRPGVRGQGGDDPRVLRGAPGRARGRSGG
ncbi:MAG: hypothetical protein H0W09_05695 [Solirubrobacterales bacterium]|nr:hypothetical protein [Solirubrobacterales bacterium]